MNLWKIHLFLESLIIQKILKDSQALQTLRKPTIKLLKKNTFALTILFESHTHKPQDLSLSYNLLSVNLTPITKVSLTSLLKSRILDANLMQWIFMLTQMIFMTSILTIFKLGNF